MPETGLSNCKFVKSVFSFVMALTRLRKPPPSQLSSNPEHHLQQRVGFDCNLSIKDSLWLSISKLEAAAPVAMIPHCGDRGKHMVAAESRRTIRLTCDWLDDALTPRTVSSVVAIFRLCRFLAIAGNRRLQRIRRGSLVSP